MTFRTSPHTEPQALTTVDVAYPTIREEARPLLETIMESFGIREYTLTSEGATGLNVPLAVAKPLEKAINRVAEQYRCYCRCCRGWLGFY